MPLGRKRCGSIGRLGRIWAGALFYLFACSQVLDPIKTFFIIGSVLRINI